MSLIGAIVDATRQRDDGTPPIRYTTEADRGWGNPFDMLGGGSVKRQLDLTTTESTLMSVLKLISRTTASVKWCGYRKQANPSEHQTRPEIGADKSLAVKLWQQPNPFMNGVHVRKVCTWHYAAVGEAWMVVDFYDEARTLPRSWWPVRPDRMTPVPDPDMFLLGYIYTGPSGERVPLDLDEVMRITDPHPTDPHRGIGPVQSLLTPLATSMSSQQWINAFFQNDGTPGGIIEIPQGLEDADYHRLRRRWNEQHRGVNRAHRVAIMEFGKWIPTVIDMQKMQFTEIRQLTRDQILEAFRIHKHKMGASDDVNLANAAAADATFAKDITLPNIEEWEALANGPYLKLFGAAGAGIDLEPEGVVPEDEAAEQAELASKVNAAVQLKGAGWDPAAILETVGLPPIPLAVVEPPPAGDQAGGGGATGDAAAPPAPGPDDVSVLPPDEETNAEKALAWAAIMQKAYLAVDGNVLITDEEGRDLLIKAGMPIAPGPLPKEISPPAVPAAPVPPGADGPIPPAGGDAAVPPGTGQDTVPAGDGGQASTPDQVLPVARSGVGVVNVDAPAVDLTQMGEDWQAALDKVLAKWPGIVDKQYSGLEKQVKAAIDGGDLAALLGLVAPDGGAEAAVTAALVAVAVTGGKAVEREAKAQGVKGVKQTAPAKDDLSAMAKVTTGFMRAALAVSAGREALRVAASGLSGGDVAAMVRTHLDALTDAQPREFLGGALTGAQNAGRAATFDAGPAATFYASEQLDSNTCAPCRKVDGKKLGTTVADTLKDYPHAGYVECLGGPRCRGTVVAKWDTGGED